jgi:hypothetical protein
MTTLDSRRFDHILLHDFIGSGPVGDVYRARDRRDGRLLAAKVLHRLPSVGEDTHRHLRQVCRAIQHLNQPTLLPWQELIRQHGHAILVRDFAEGISLAEVLASDGPLPIDRVLAIGRALAESLAHAHAIGPHLNLKPANIFLRVDDDRPLLVDFQLPSLARTAAYPCPQHCLGQPLTRRADLWAFGALLFEMLCGRPPFPAETGNEVCLPVLGQSLPKVEQMRPETPLALVELLDRLLAKHSADRPPDIRLVGALLEGILNARRAGHHPDDPHHVYRITTPIFWEHPFQRPLPQAVDDELSPSQIFVAAVQRFQPDFTPSPAEMALIEDIVVHLDNELLAIRLAAGLYGPLSLAELRAEVARALATQAHLSHEGHSSPALWAMLRKAFAQLTFRQQEALVSLTVFRGGFSWATARAVCQVNLSTLHTLIRRGLLVRDSASGRYDLPPDVHHFAAARLARRPLNTDRLRAIHAACFGLRLENTTPNISPRVMERLYPDLDNMRAAWEWATGRAGLTVLGKMLDTLFAVMNMAGRPQEALNMAGQALEMLDNESGVVDKQEQREIKARLQKFLDEAAGADEEHEQR